MTETRTPAWPLLAFAVWLLVLGSTTAFVLGRPDYPSHAGVLGPALAIDLTLTTALVAWLLLVRTGIAATRTLVPLTLLGLAVAWRLDLVSGGLAVPLGIAAGVGELVVGGFALLRIRQIRAVWLSERESDPDGALETALASALHPVLASAVAGELTLLRLALTSWRTPPPKGPGIFSTHEESGWTAIVGGVMLLVVAETIGLHLFVARYSEVGAWLLTAASAYSALWILGDTQALRLHPIRVADGVVRVSIGLRWRVRIPLEHVASAEPTWEADEGELDLGMAGAPRVLLVLTEPVTVRGMFGIRQQTDRLVLPVDDREGFVALLSRGQSPHLHR